MLLLFLDTIKNIQNLSALRCRGGSVYVTSTLSLQSVLFIYSLHLHMFVTPCHPGASDQQLSHHQPTFTTLKLPSHGLFPDAYRDLLVGWRYTQQAFSAG